MDNQSYVILQSENGKHFTLKERVKNGFNAGLYTSNNIENVQEFADQNNIEVEAVGTFYELVR